MTDKKHTTGREGWEDSEERYYDGIGSPNQADRMISQAEEGQVLKPLPAKYQVTDEELEADFLNLLTSKSSGSVPGERLRSST